MTYKITLANSKGGIGKTTISSMISYHLSTKGYKVLLVDLDPQANATAIINKTFYKNVDNDYLTLYEGLESKKIKNAIHEINENFSFIPSSQNTTDFSKLLNANNKYTLLRNSISQIENDYDFIFYDVPPTIFTDFINNALVASDYFVILSETSEFSFSGIGDMYDTGKKMSEINKSLDFLGILINMREDDEEIIQELDDKYNMNNEEMFFQTYIPKRKRVAKYAKHGMFGYNKDTFIKHDRWDLELINTFNDLSNELMNRISKSAKGDK